MKQIDWTIIRKGVDGILSESEREQLDEWRTDSASNEEFYRKVEKFHTKKQKYKVDSNKRFKTFKAQIELQPSKRKIGFWRYAASIAAVALLCFSIWQTSNYINKPHESNLADSYKIEPGNFRAILETSAGDTISLSDSGNHTIILKDITINQQKNVVDYSLASNCKKMEYHTIRIPRGGEYNLRLSDGTIVYLNSESSLTFPITFIGNKREVILSGQGYFEVTHNALMPFVVKSNQADIEVLGTTFDVKSYPEESTMTTTLIEGSVKVSAYNMSAILEPSEQVIVSEGQNFVKQIVDTDQFVAWKNGRIAFVDEPLFSIIKRLERWYDVEFQFSDETIKNICFTGNMDRYQTLSEVLVKLDKTKEIYFDVNDRKITINKQK